MRILSSISVAFVLILPIAGVHAQLRGTTSSAPSLSTPGVSPCLINCFSKALAEANISGCASLDGNVTTGLLEKCLCPNIQQSLSCVQSMCAQADIEALQHSVQPLVFPAQLFRSAHWSKFFTVIFQFYTGSFDITAFKQRHNYKL
ncbi:hypothetical protein C8Q76DRAFT_804409 [Earliella scabrosa]|nr:hypothetical protein C8Q76DRAFT_804409 [Earliella scabrosa]